MNVGNKSMLRVEEGKPIILTNDSNHTDEVSSGLVERTREEKMKKCIVWPNRAKEYTSSRHCVSRRNGDEQILNRA